MPAAMWDGLRATEGSLPAPAQDTLPSNRRILALRISNAISFVLVCVANALGATGTISGNAVGDIARANVNYILPASSAFSIWGVIYFFNALFVIYQAVPRINSDKVLLFQSIGWWYCASSLCNAAWIVTFTLGTATSIWASTVLLFGLVLTLTVAYVRSNMWQAQRTSVFEFFVVDVTFSLYLGWTTAASILNVATAFVASGLGSGEPWTAEGWGCLMLGVAAVVYLTMLRTRGDTVFALVFAWAAYWIGQQERQEGVTLPPSDTVGAVAFTLSAVVGVLAVMELGNVLARSCQGVWRGRLSSKSGEPGDGPPLRTMLWFPRVRRGSSLQDPLV